MGGCGRDLLFLCVFVPPWTPFHYNHPPTFPIAAFRPVRSKEQSQFYGLKAGNGGFTLLIEAFTSNTFIMIVTPPSAHDEATLLNMALARPVFDSLIATI